MSNNDIVEIVHVHARDVEYVSGGCISASVYVLSNLVFRSLVYVCECIGALGYVCLYMCTYL